MRFRKKKCGDFHPVLHKGKIIKKKKIKILEIKKRQMSKKNKRGGGEKEKKQCAKNLKTRH